MRLYLPRSHQGPNLVWTQQRKLWCCACVRTDMCYEEQAPTKAEREREALHGSAACIICSVAESWSKHRNILQPSCSVCSTYFQVQHSHPWSVAMPVRCTVNLNIFFRIFLQLQEEYMLCLIYPIGGLVQVNWTFSIIHKLIQYWMQQQKCCLLCDTNVLLWKNMLMELW